ncbi:MAG: nucleotidyl transferase AbiEii/AbiGii toxin family protein, partial [Actinomycetota bacterium]
MIPAAFITEWANTAAWPTVEQVEQDLVLSRLIIKIANDGYLGEELVFRGGTCLHKLHLDSALRYSEDLDCVRRSTGSIGEIIDAIREIANGLGMSVSTKITTNPKIRLHAPFESGNGTMNVKIEVNTTNARRRWNSSELPTQSPISGTGELPMYRPSPSPN